MRGHTYSCSKSTDRCHMDSPEALIYGAVERDSQLEDKPRDAANLAEVYDLISVNQEAMVLWLLTYPSKKNFLDKCYCYCYLQVQSSVWCTANSAR